MKRLINYIRQCFCKHNFEVITVASHVKGAEYPHKRVRHFICNKCLYHQKIRL